MRLFLFSISLSPSLSLSLSFCPNPKNNRKIIAGYNIVHTHTHTHTTHCLRIVFTLATLLLFFCFSFKINEKYRLNSHSNVCAIANLESFTEGEKLYMKCARDSFANEKENEFLIATLKSGTQSIFIKVPGFI